MLSDKLRDGANSKGFKALLVVIVVSFVLTGVGGYLIPRLDTDPVHVGDYKITNNEWTEQYNRRAQQLHRYGPQAAALLENPQYVIALKKQLLESMIDNVAFNSSVWNMNVRIGTEQVKEVIRHTPAFQKDGVFDEDLFIATVRNMGMSPDMFGEQLRLSLMTESISRPLLRLSSTPMPYELEAIAKMLAQKRTVNLYTVNSEDILKNLSITDEEAKAYYDANHDKFMAPATVRFTYLLLSQNDLQSSVEVTKEKLEEFFSLYQSDFAVPEHRQISHIIIRKDTEKAGEKVAELEAALAKGEDFAVLAKKFSDDNATKDNGGDMGLVAQGELAENLDTVLFSLKNVGDISTRIEDSYGTHFIKLTKIEAPHIPTLKEAKDKVTTAYINAEARDLYNQKFTTMSDLSFENPDSLDITAENLGLKILDSDVLNYGDRDARWPLNTPEVQKLAFNEDVYSSGVNSTVISIDEKNSIVLNVSEHHDASLKPFETVKEEALALVKQQKLHDECMAALQNVGEKVKADAAAELPKNITVRENVVISASSSEVSPEFSQAIFALPRGSERAFVIADNNTVDTLAVLQKVEEGDANTLQTFEQIISAQLNQYLNLNAQQAVYRQARLLNEIEYNQEAIDLVTRNTSGE